MTTKGIQISDIAITVASVVAALFAFIQWRSMRVEARSTEMDLLRQLQADWLALKPQWHRAILAAIGPDNFYSPAESETRDRFKGLVEEIVVGRPEPGTKEMQHWRRRTRDASHEFEQAQRDVLFFLATLASEVFRGRLSPALAYDVVGLDVTRRSRQVRVLLGHDSARWEHEPEEDSFGMKVSDLQSLISSPDPDKDVFIALIEDLSGVSLDEVGFDEALERIKKKRDERVFDCPWNYWVGSSPGLTDRILGLLDVLWGQTAKLHDVETHDLVGVAELKRKTGSGERNRRRIRRLCREHGSRWTGVRLEWFLLNSEFISLGPPRRVQSLALENIPREVRGRGLVGRIRKSWAFLRGRMELAARSERFCDPEDDPDLVVRLPVEDPSQGVLRRIFLVGTALLAFETVLIAVFGDHFYADEAAVLGAVGMVLTAATGYFLLGYFSRSWWSAVSILTMLMVAVIIGKSGPSYSAAHGSAVSVHDNAGLATLWLKYSIIFVPVWALGTVLGMRCIRETKAAGRA